MHELLNAYDVT